MQIGSQAATAFKIGAQDVDSIYIGSTLVFSATTEDTTAPVIDTFTITPPSTAGGDPSITIEVSDASSTATARLVATIDDPQSYGTGDGQLILDGELDDGSPATVLSSLINLTAGTPENFTIDDSSFGSGIVRFYLAVDDGEGNITEPQSVSYARVTDADAFDLIERQETASSTTLEDGVKIAYHDFFAGLKTDSQFANIDAACIIAGAPDVASALLPMVDTMPTPTNYNGNIVAGDFNRKTGIKGGGSAKFIETGYFFADNANDDRHAAIYVSELPTTGTQLIGMENRNVNSSTSDVLIFTSITRCADKSSNSYTASAGFIAVKRDDNFTHERRNNGSTSTVTGAAIESQTAGAFELWILNDNDAGTSTDARVAFYGFGSDADLGLIQNRVDQLITGIGAALP